MLFHTNPNDHTGAIDLYPHTDDDTQIIYQNRLTIMYGKIYLDGNEWTLEHIQREKERIARLEATFKVAQAVVECEKTQTCPICHTRPAAPTTRTDHKDRHWCQECQDEFDSIDWYEVAAEAERASLEELAT